MIFLQLTHYLSMSKSILNCQTSSKVTTTFAIALTSLNLKYVMRIFFYKLGRYKFSIPLEKVFVS